MKPWGLHLYKFKKERRRRRGSKILMKSDALSGTTSRPSPTLGGTDECLYHLPAFRSCDS